MAGAARAAGPGRRRRGAARAALALAFALLVLAAGTAGRDAALYPPAPGTGRVVTVVDHGWHATLVIGAADLRAAALALGREDAEAARMLRALVAPVPAGGWLELGWGDAAVYRGTRRVTDLHPGEAIAALAWPTPAVVHVVALGLPAGRAFPASAHRRLALSSAGFEGLAARLAATLARDGSGRPVDLGPGLYGGGRFHASRLSYSALRTCNHWVAWLLRGAGVPASWSASATSAGLMAELALRTAPPPAELGY